MTTRPAATTKAGVGEGQEEEEALRDRPFEPWRRPASAEAGKLVQWVTSVFEQREAHRNPRKRRRRPDDQKTMEETVAALVCDAAHRELTEPGGRVMLSLSNQKLGTRSRYRAPVMSKVLPHILEVLTPDILRAEKGFVNPFGASRQTTFALADNFKPVVRSHRLTLADLWRAPGGELVVLKKAREDYWSGGALVEYHDTPTTNAFRDEVQQINARLAELDVDFDDDHSRRATVDLRDRAVRRIFNNGRFDQGGRLYGGFWQALRKKDRADALRLDGDSVVTLDFRQMAPRLLYAQAGAQPPADCYSVPGYERFRSGWKKLLNSMLFAGTGLGRLPKGTGALLPPRIGVERAKALILEHNAPIASLIHPDVGFGLMFQESEILIDILLEMAPKDVPALPIHDAVIVPEYLKEIAAEVMDAVFRRHTGQPGAVSIEGREMA